MKIGNDTNSPRKTAQRERPNFFYRSITTINHTTIETSNNTGASGDGAIVGDGSTGRNDTTTTGIKTSPNEDEEREDHHILDVEDYYEAQ